MEQSESQDKIKEIEGDLFDAPDGAALIHACNCLGSWGNGIALAFRNKYPAAFQVYKAHCLKYLNAPKYKVIQGSPDAVSESTAGSAPKPRRIQLPEGSALIIPPQKRDYEKLGRKHWIVCLFTSRKFGRNVSSTKVILANTELAIVDMVKQLDRIKTREPGSADISISALWSCRFNAGLFGVEWALSRKILKDANLEVTVVRPPGQ